MKIYKQITMLLLLLSMIYSQRAMCQEQSLETLLIGTWTFDYDTTIQEMDVSSKLGLDTIPSFERENIEKNYRGRLAIFKDNGDYEQIFAGGIIAHGKWVLVKDEEKIIITNPNNIELKLKIKTLTTTQLVLKPITESDNNMLIPIWIFIKSNN